MCSLKRTSSGKLRSICWEGGDVLKDFLEYMEMMPDGAMGDNIQELNCIMSRQPIDRKLLPVEGRILKLLVYGG